LSGSCHAGYDCWDLAPGLSTLHLHEQMHKDLLTIFMHREDKNAISALLAASPPALRDLLLISLF